MRLSQGIMHAAVLALSTMILPDGLSDDGPLFDPDSMRDPNGTGIDDSDDDDPPASDLAPVLDACKRQRKNVMSHWREAFAAWAPSREPDLQQRAVNYLCVLMLLESHANPLTQCARKEVLSRLCQEVPGEEIVQAMTRLELEPSEIAVILSAPELGLPEAHSEREVRQGCSKMVRMFLYRLTPRLAK